jgi:hypothetical protein
MFAVRRLFKEVTNFMTFTYEARRGGGGGGNRVTMIPTIQPQERELQEGDEVEVVGPSSNNYEKLCGALVDKLGVRCKVRGEKRPGYSFSITHTDYQGGYWFPTANLRLVSTLAKEAPEAEVKVEYKPFPGFPK